MYKYIFLFIFFLIFFSSFSSVKLYEKKYAKKNSFLYSSTNFDTILGKIYTNDEIIILKTIKVNNNEFFYVKTGLKKGIIKNIVCENQTFPKKIKFTRTSQSFLIHSINSQNYFKKIKNNDEFIIESTFRYKDNQYIYFLCSLGFYLKINIFDEYSISNNLIQKEEQYD